MPSAGGSLDSTQANVHPEYQVYMYLAMAFFALSSFIGDWLCASAGIAIAVISYAAEPKNIALRNNSILAALLMGANLAIRVGISFFGIMLFAKELSAGKMTNSNAGIILGILAINIFLSLFFAAIFAFLAYKSYREKGYLLWKFVK